MGLDPAVLAALIKTDVESATGNVMPSQTFVVWGGVAQAIVAYVPTGQLLAPSVRLTGVGSGTLPIGTCVIRLRFTAQGGGGGGATTGSGAGAGAGGSSGEVVEVEIGVPGVPLVITTYSWSMGSSGGGGGSSAGGNGSNGENSTFTYNGITYTATGGVGGTGATGIASVGNWNPLSLVSGTPALGVSGVLRRTFGLGAEGKTFNGAWISGNGGTNEFGSGGVMVGGLTAGNNGAGNGGGGGGAAAGGGGGRTGGNGAVGAGIISFYS